MKTIFLILFLLLCPLIAGYGAVTLYNIITSAVSRKQKPAEKPFFMRICTAFPIGVCIELLIAGVSNVICVFLHLDLSAGKKLFAALLIAVLTVFYFVLIINRFMKAMKKLNGGAAASGKESTNGSDTNSQAGKEAHSGKYAVPLLILGSVVLSIVLVFLTVRGYTDYSGDQTLETVNSFVTTGQLYSVDPLTGLPYTNGYPTRLSLMALPFFYSVLAVTFSVTPYVLLWYIIPVYFLLAGLSVFVILADSLFKEKRNKIIFYLISVFLLLCTNVSIGSPGFDILHAGFRGSTFLNVVLLNLTFCFCMKKKWVACALPIILEPLIASTAFGAGGAFFVTLCMILISKLPVFKKITGGVC